MVFRFLSRPTNLCRFVGLFHFRQIRRTRGLRVPDEGHASYVPYEKYPS